MSLICGFCTKRGKACVDTGSGGCERGRFERECAGQLKL